MIIASEIARMLDAPYISFADYMWMRKSKQAKAIPFHLRARFINEYRRKHRRAM